MIRQNMSRKGLLQKILKNSINTKRKAKWSRETGAGFIHDDIKDIKVVQHYVKYSLRIKFADNAEIETAIPDLNLRETEEALKWVERNL